MKTKDSLEGDKEEDHKDDEQQQGDNCYGHDNGDRIQIIPIVSFYN